MAAPVADRTSHSVGPDLVRLRRCQITALTMPVAIAVPRPPDRPCRAVALGSIRQFRAAPPLFLNCGHMVSPDQSGSRDGALNAILVERGWVIDNNLTVSSAAYRYHLLMIVARVWHRALIDLPSKSLVSYRCAPALRSNTPALKGFIKTTGINKWFNSTKGFWLHSARTTAAHAFVHFGRRTFGSRNSVEGQKLSYDMELHRVGKMSASNLQAVWAGYFTLSDVNRYLLAGYPKDSQAAARSFYFSL
ncbi:hypothetical protein [Paracoccus yeei]|uniref:hypothetical protein n=1 Tax=Paracoccus yeei TaxID=147645 RepID=UPI003BF891B5